MYKKANRNLFAKGMNAMMPIIDHIHITVEDLDRAERFYDKLLPLLGFDISLKEYDCVPEHEYRIVEYHKRMVAELNDHIDVYHVEKQDGVTTQHITIYYNCIGAFDVPDRRKIPRLTFSCKREKA